jgi:hypothetical protein
MKVSGQACFNTQPGTIRGHCHRCYLELPPGLNFMMTPSACWNLLMPDFNWDSMSGELILSTCHYDTLQGAWGHSGYGYCAPAPGASRPGGTGAWGQLWQCWSCECGDSVAAMLRVCITRTSPWHSLWSSTDHHAITVSAVSQTVQL